MKILVTGGRDFNSYPVVCRALGPFKPTFLVMGDASGLDRLAEKFAQWTNCPYRKYEADWKTYGRAAGPIRNREMLLAEKPDVVVAFPGGAGTADMVRTATHYNYPVAIINSEGDIDEWRNESKVVGSAAQRRVQAG